MKKILFVIISILLFFPIQVKGATNEEIINDISEKQELICDKSTNQLFNTYRLLFTRMLKEKELSNDDLERILTNLKNAVLLIEENDICKKTDLDTLPSNVKTKIKELRAAADLTQQQLADLVHVSSRTIISIEKGQYNPSLMLAYRIAQVFGVSVEELCCLQENKELEDQQYENLP